MEYVIPQKNEAGFLRWERLGRRAKHTLRASPLLLTLLVVFLLICTLIEAQGVGVGEEEDEAWELAIVGIMLIVYPGVPMAYWRWSIKPKLVRLSKDACIFTALVATEELERGNPVRASLSMGKLLLALSDFLGQKLVALGVSSVTPMDIMHVTPQKIPKRAVFRAIQANEDTKDFQERLRNLAIGLHGNVDAGYPAAHQFLVWLDQKTETYQHASKSFLDKYPNLKTLGSIVAAIAVIVVEILRQTG